MALIKSVPFFGGFALRAVCPIKAVSFKLNGGRRVDLVDLSSAFGTYRYRLIVETLILAKLISAVVAFIPVNWQILLPSVFRAFGITTR